MGGTPLGARHRLGIFTSATVRTVATVRELLESAAGVPPGGLFEPQLVLYRDHTRPAPAEHVQAGGQKWDTVKPLGQWFRRLHRCVWGGLGLGGPPPRLSELEVLQRVGAGFLWSRS